MPFRGLALVRVSCFILVQPRSEPRFATAERPRTSVKPDRGAHNPSCVPVTAWKTLRRHVQSLLPVYLLGDPAVGLL